MKYLYIMLLTIFVSTYTASAQVVTSNNLLPYVKEFIESANEEGIAIAKNVNMIDSILIHIPRLKADSAIGCVTGGNGEPVIIDIHPYIMGYPPLVQRTVYHELGHVFGMLHCHKQCDHIMSATVNDSYIQYNTSWELHKLIFFNKLKARCTKVEK